MSIYRTIYASQEAFLAHSEKIYEERLFSSRRAKSSKGHDCQKFQRNAAVRRAPGLLKTIVKPHRFQLNYHIKERCVRNMEFQ